MSKSTHPISKFLHHEAAPSIVLLSVTLFTLLFVNLGYFDTYQHFLHIKFSFLPGKLGEMSLHHWINDALMSIFFFQVGLEIKREVFVGNLSSYQKANLPIIAAIGGIIFPIIVFKLLNQHPDASSGWAIPMATDIAFSLGIIKLLGNRIPTSLKVFLTAFAVADDLGAIVVIALFYSTEINTAYILYGMLILGFMSILTFYKKYNTWLYLSLGVVVWYLFLLSGIHATIAGVLLAFTIPLMHRKKRLFPLKRLESFWHSWVGFGIMPIFAFANAGVVFSSDFANFDVSSAIAAGLVFGKLIGISLFCWLAIKLGISKIPRGTNMKQIFFTALLGGVGFTMSLFIAELSFDTTNQAYLLDASKIGILMGSLVAGIGGYIGLRLSTKNTAA
ncbi:MAG: Na+/H+ antiporter NhaA [Mangrovibacterium sp.]